MEFYATSAMRPKNLTSSFNSQRDGILLKRTNAERKIKRVSIPNGMEFYMDKFITDNVEKIRFQFPTGWNSTIGMNNGEMMVLFQFPMGWNSTGRDLDGERAWYIVSIPNGMEFYTIFQSMEYILLAVSIPNGMEFYVCG